MNLLVLHNTYYENRAHIHCSYPAILQVRLKPIQTKQNLSFLPLSTLLYILSIKIKHTMARQSV